MNIPTTKIIIMNSGSLYESADTMDLKENFTYNSFLNAMVHNSFFYDMSILIYSEFGIQYKDDRYEEILKKIKKGFKED